MQHRRVADDDGFVDALTRSAGGFVELLQDRVHGALNGLAQLRLGLIALHAVADPGDDVGAERCLAVERRPDGLRHSRAQVHQRADDRRGAQVEGDTVALLARVARFDGDQLIAAKHGRNLELSAAKQGRERAKDAKVGLHVEALGGEGVAESLDVAALVLEIRLGQLHVDLPDVGIEQHQPVDAHGRGLRNS